MTTNQNEIKATDGEGVQSTLTDSGGSPEAQLVAALKLAKKRLEWYGCAASRKDFDHDLNVIHPVIDDALALSVKVAAELADWKQAARVEAGLRREFYDRAIAAERALEVFEGVLRGRVLIWKQAHAKEGHGDCSFPLLEECEDLLASLMRLKTQRVVAPNPAVEEQ